ncbi:hypothetical protein, partial [Pseudoramibacter alactolyticus]|uniref:hypothetical protein n=1 Tax=Pseudoramibacter alactolyticus TaxID=113287 RepID=UPI00248EE141
TFKVSGTTRPTRGFLLYNKARPKPGSPPAPSGRRARGPRHGRMGAQFNYFESFKMIYHNARLSFCSVSAGVGPNAIQIPAAVFPKRQTRLL